MTQRREGAGSSRPALYQSPVEHDNCGIGAVVNIKGRKSHETVEKALKIVENLEHRAGKDAREKRVTELESYCRYRINSSPEPVVPSAFF